MGSPKITLYVDIVSPFGYMAYWTLRHSPVFQPCDITFVPILLGGIMKLCGNTPPLYVKNKDKWIGRERESWAKQFNIPMRETMPSGFPINTVTVQRVLTAIALRSPPHLPQALDTLYAALWAPETLTHPPSPKGTEYDMKNVEVLSALLSPPSILGAGLAKSVISSMGSAEVKAQLTKNTNQAFEDGTFGLPWFQCTNSGGETEGFWGFDHLGQVVRFLGLNGELGENKIRPML